jgi:hypothetical protein
MGTRPRVDIGGGGFGSARGAGPVENRLETLGGVVQSTGLTSRPEYAERDARDLLQRLAVGAKPCNSSHPLDGDHEVAG